MSVTRISLHKLDQKINLQLREHINSDESDGWEWKEQVQYLYEYAVIFQAHFNLEIPVPAIGIKKIRKNRLAEYHELPNAHSLKWVIIYNSQHMKREPYRILMTLLHEMLHLWQQVNGEPAKRNHHNKQFRKKALEYGLNINGKGFTWLVEGLLTDFFEENGITFSIDDEEEKPDEPERTRVVKVKWSCDCDKYTIRVETDEKVNLKCLDCKKKFKVKK